jgi:hydrogenase maturation protease
MCALSDHAGAASHAAPPGPSTDTLVLALGNPHRGDDGAGPAVAAALQASPLPRNTSVVDGGTPGLETALLLQGYRRAIIVDAADMGLEPGEWARWQFGQADLEAAAMVESLHEAGLAEALTLGEALGILPAEIVLYGIQPHETGWGEGLSASVAAAIPAVRVAIAQELLGG